MHFTNYFFKYKTQHMNRAIKLTCLAFSVAFTCFSASAQLGGFGKGRINARSVEAVQKGAKALTFTNADAIKLSKEGVVWMDDHNPVAAANDPYAIRLERIFGKHKNENGLALNYKVYKVKDINAFACADGSVRVFSSLMDILTDDELLAVVGHEIGHVKNEDTKDAIKSAYMRAAITDASSSQSGAVRVLTDGELGVFTENFLGASHSRKQESEADSYSYEFLKKHNYNVVGAYSAFRKLALLSGGAEPTISKKMMSSHPDSEARAAEVKKRAEKDDTWKDPGTISLPKKRLTS